MIKIGIGIGVLIGYLLFGGSVVGVEPARDEDEGLVRLCNAFDRWKELGKPQSDPAPELTARCHGDEG